jgi:hypothetical protein
VSNVGELDILLMHNKSYAAEIAHNVSAAKRVTIIEKARGAFVVWGWTGSNAVCSPWRQGDQLGSQGQAAQRRGLIYLFFALQLATFLRSHWGRRAMPSRWANAVQARLSED